MRAFVLCKLASGKERETLEKIRAVEGVNEVTMVFGSWDAILCADADTIDKLSTLIINEVRKIPGVEGTETLVTTSA